MTRREIILMAILFAALVCAIAWIVATPRTPEGDLREKCEREVAPWETGECPR